jgi:hypothetical protein
MILLWTDVSFNWLIIIQSRSIASDSISLWADSTRLLGTTLRYACASLQNQKPLVFLGVQGAQGTPRKHHGSNFRDVPSCSKENVLGKDYLLKRNQYKNFQDVINANRGTSNRIWRESVVFPHVQKNMCWERIICHKGISTRIFFDYKM